MVMIREKGKGLKIAEKVMKQKGIQVRKPNSSKLPALKGPYIQH